MGNSAAITSHAFRDCAVGTVNCLTLVGSDFPLSLFVASTMQFNELNLVAPLLRALTEEGYTQPSPIQQQSIPAGLEGKDVLGIAQTGTGKTAAFALPILQRLLSTTVAQRPDEQPVQRRGGQHPHRRSIPQARRAIRALVLAPTRELATQIAESFRAYGRHTSIRTAVVFGGVGAGRQIQELRSGVDVLVACPGRLLDLIGQGHVYLGGVQVLVLDEADRMLDMGFMPDIKRVLTHVPEKRQTLLYSATMPKEIQSLADKLLSEPVRVEVAPVSTPAERVEHLAYFVPKAHKPALLQHLLTASEGGLPGAAKKRVLVFARTKRGADRVAERLTRSGVRAECIHGNKSQGARERALESFRRGTSPVLVATDLAARGLDVDGISHVVNFDLPNEPETFVHRIGRTARAGASGYAISFCDAEESEYLVDIEALINSPLPKQPHHPHHCTHAEAAHTNFEDRRTRKTSGLPIREIRKLSYQQQPQPREGRRSGPPNGGSARRGNSAGSGSNRNRQGARSLTEMGDSSGPVLMSAARPSGSAQARNRNGSDGQNRRFGASRKPRFD